MTGQTLVDSEDYPQGFDGTIELSELEEQYLDRWKAEGYFDDLDAQVARLQAVETGVTLYYPTSHPYFITQGYRQPNHPAYDFGMPNRTPLYASARGQVSFMGQSYGYAYNLRIIIPDWKLMCLYAHMPANGTWADGLRVGAWVEPKQHVGYSNNTGYSTGPHLHYEVRKPPYGGYPDAVDYYNWLVTWDKPGPPPPPPSTYPYKAKVIKKDGLTVYSKPKSTSLAVRRLPFGTIITVTGDAPDDKVRNWVKLADGYIIANTAKKTYIQKV